MKKLFLLLGLCCALFVGCAAETTDEPLDSDPIVEDVGEETEEAVEEIGDEMDDVEDDLEDDLEVEEEPLIE